MGVHRLASTATARLDQSTAQRMARIRAEAAELATAHTSEFQRAIVETLAHADDIADGGEAYRAGVRELARSLSIELRTVLLGLEALLQRPA